MKNPIYATAIGLVLAGFKSVDERENQYKSQQNKVRQPAEHGTSPFSRNPPPEEKKKTTRDYISDLFGNYKEKFFGDINGNDY